MIVSSPQIVFRGKRTTLFRGHIVAVDPNEAFLGPS